MNPQLLEDLRRDLNSAGLEPHADAILARALPAVRLKLGQPSSAVGESRIGGVPDLPVGMMWPRNASNEALTFILQLNLARLPAFDENPLPRTGMLYFFVGLDEPASDVEHRVFLHPLESTLELATPPPLEEFANEDNYRDLPPHALELELFADVPRWATTDFDALTADMTEDEIDAYGDFGSRNSREIGQLLGHVATIGHDTREDAFVVREVNRAWLYDYREREKLDMARAARWRNLLRVDSIMELDFTIWDAGFFNVLVKDDDLERLNFENVYVCVETS